MTALPGLARRAFKQRHHEEEAFLGPNKDRNNIGIRVFHAEVEFLLKTRVPIPIEAFPTQQLQSVEMFIVVDSMRTGGGGCSRRKR